MAILANYLEGKEKCPEPPSWHDVFIQIQAGQPVADRLVAAIGLIAVVRKRIVSLARLGRDKVDGFAKSPISVLRCILRHSDVQEVRLIPQDLRALNLELFALPSNSAFCETIKVGPFKEIRETERPLKNVQFCSSPRLARILTTGTH